jgi:hypothetical protein
MAAEHARTLALQLDAHAQRAVEPNLKAAPWWPAARFFQESKQPESAIRILRTAAIAYGIRSVSTGEHPEIASLHGRQAREFIQGVERARTGQELYVRTPREKYPSLVHPPSLLGLEQPAPRVLVH